MWRAAKPSRESNVKIFSLVSRSDHTLTNQQFVNCAYLEILSLCLLPCPVCLPVDKPSPLACQLHAEPSEA